MKNAVIAVVSLIAALAVVAGGTVALWSGSPAPDATNDTETASAASGSAEVAPLAQLASAAMLTTDGVIYAGEYRNNLYDSQTGMSLFWQNDAASLYVGLISPGTGWLGVGFSHRTSKPGSNIIIGAVANGTVTIQDGYGVTKELHLPDKTSSILAFGGSEENGQTTIEFVIPLASSDSQDTTLAPGETVQVILAYQATWDSFTTQHTSCSMTQITLDP
jgi:hypothetical protein